MTKSQEVYERINALVDQGLSKADAFRQLAAEYQQPVKSVQGTFYSARRAATGSSKPRKRETTTADALADAVAVLERAVEAIDREIDAAKERAEEAKAEYEALKRTATSRKQAITTKIAALNA